MVYLKKENSAIAILITLLWVIFLAWIFLFNINASFIMPQAAWSFSGAAMAALMWIVMMAAMMLPAASPMILTFSNIYSRQVTLGKSFVPTWIFVAGYAAVWSVFAVIASGAQLLLQSFALLSGELSIISPAFGGIILIIAGVYQLTPLKSICLKNCQSPFDFLMTRWRDGRNGAFAMGLHHGLYCLGCCWALMLLLFAAGIMNLLWVALIATFIFVEKIAAFGKWPSRIAGAIFILWGASLVFG